MTEWLEQAGIAVIPLPTPFMVGPVNVYVIKGDPPLLIDVGPLMDEAYDKLVKRLDRLGYRLTDIGGILLTHDHIDHGGQLGRVLAESGAEAWAHPHAVAHLAAYDDRKDEALARFTALMRELGASGEDLDIIIQDRIDDSGFAAGAQIQHTLSDGQSVHGFRVHFVPGHSASDVLFVREDLGLAFSGDHVLKAINPSPLLRIPLEGETRGKALVELRHSFEHTRSLALRCLCPGHGDPFDGHGAIIDKLLSRHERRNKQVFGLLEEGPKTPFELARTLFPDLEMIHMYLGLSVATAHCELLEERGRVLSHHQDGVLHYAAVTEAQASHERSERH